MKRTTYQSKMSAEERDAVDAFAAVYGRRWRSELRECMARARYPLVTSDQAAALQSIRNRRGVAWISKHVILPAACNPFTTPLDDPHIKAMIADTASVWER